MFPVPRRFLLLALVAAAFPASASARTRCHGAPVASASAQNEPLVELTPLVPTCFDNKAEAEFRHQYGEFQADEAQQEGQASLSLANVENALKHPPHGGTCKDRFNTAYSQAKAKLVLDTLLPRARKFLDGAGLDLEAMKRELRFAAHNKAVQASIRSQLGEFGQGLTALFQVNSAIRTSATKLNALDCNAALVEEENASGQFSGAMKTINDAQRAIDRRLVEFDKAPCKDLATEGAPMSPGQVNHLAGGGGTQSGNAGKLNVLAPRRLRGRKGALLPLTIRARANGFVRVELTRGRTTVTGVSGLMHRGAAGLRLTLLRGASRGIAGLRITFSSSSHRTAIKTLSIRIA